MINSYTLNIYNFSWFNGVIFKLKTSNTFFKDSCKFIEERLAHKQASAVTDAPEYIRINNFGERKTGWLKFNPIKVEVNIIGKITRKIERY